MLLTALVLAIPSGRASASTSVPTLLPFPKPVAGDYVIEAITCTPTGTAQVCGEIVDIDTSGKSVSTPTFGAFGCYRISNSGGPEQAEFVIFGTGLSYTAGDSSGGGIAGVTSETGVKTSNWQATAENFLVGRSTASPFNSSLHGGTTSGVSLGSVQISNSMERVIGGKILISVSGTIWNSNGTSSQGSMSCTIAPSSTGESIGIATNQNLGF